MDTYELILIIKGENEEEKRGLPYATIFSVWTGEGREGYGTVADSQTKPQEAGSGVRSDGARDVGRYGEWRVEVGRVWGSGSTNQAHAPYSQLETVLHQSYHRNPFNATNVSSVSSSYSFFIGAKCQPIS